jgi:uncharacterized protein YbjT (DUF2867 family)
MEERHMKVLVTGATGNVGSHVVEQLLAGGHAVRVFTRDAAKVTGWDGQVELALGDFTQPETFAQAARGTEAVFLMNGALDGGVFRGLVATAKEADVRRVVFLSSLFAADPGLAIGRLHKDKEDVLVGSGLEVGIVRAGEFMSNARQWIGPIRGEGVVYNAVGEGKTAPTHPADIAAVAVHALTAAKLTETYFDVTGGALMTTAEKVALLAKAIGKPLRTVDVPAETVVQALVKNGVPAVVAPALGESFAATREGRAAQVTDTVTRLTGQKPRTYAEWAEENKERFA